MGNVYIGVNDVAHKIKGAYVGVDGVARKIKQIYIGVNGVARLVWKAVQGFTQWKSLMFSSPVALTTSTTSSHDVPYISGLGIKKIKDNEFIYNATITYRLSNESSQTTSYRKIITVDDNGYITSDSYAKTYDAYYLNGYYYFIPYGTYLDSSYPLVKHTSLSSSASGSNITVLTYTTINKYYLINYCKVDNNTFAAFFKYSNSTNYSYLIILFDSNGFILDSHNDISSFISSADYINHSELFYVRDKVLVCIAGTKVCIIEISDDYKTRTVNTIDLGSFSYNGTSFTYYTSDNFRCYNGNIVATFDVENGYPQNYHRIFMPIKIDYNNKTVSVGTSKLVENCGSISMTDNWFVENNTIIIFSKKSIDNSNYGHYCFLIPYDNATNTFDNYTVIDGSNLISGGTYDYYYGFIPIKDNANPSKLFLFDTSRTQLTATGGNDSWQFYYRTGSITLE